MFAVVSGVIREEMKFSKQKRFVCFLTISLLCCLVLQSVRGRTAHGSGPDSGQGRGFVPQAVLEAEDGLANDRFGHAVAISGDTAIVGAPGDDVGVNTEQGSAYIFVRSGTTWIQQA